MKYSGTDLTHLLADYLATEPHRARGGISALTGFQFQIWFYLADYAKALVCNNLLVGGQAFTEAFETLSDYTRGDKGGTICVQAKYRLDRRGMAAAAAEFAAIERFLDSSHRSELRKRISYEVVACSGTKSLDWANIQLTKDIRARDPGLAGYFEQARSEGRLRQPRIEPDPRWKLISTVYGQLRDPFGFARKSYELCLNRTGEPASASLVRDAIAELYIEGVPNAPLLSRALSPGDVQADAHGTGVSLAKTPTLDDLRQGRFMPRPLRVAEVVATLDDLRESTRGSSDPSLPVLWIDGRSGSGKSVLLLQVVQHLVIERKSSVIWFASGGKDISATIELLAKTDESLRPDYLCIDDIYDPQTREVLDVSHITRLVVHGGASTWPILITCGPTEFRQDFERDCRAEGFRVWNSELRGHHTYLSLACRYSQSKHRAWQELRRGHRGLPLDFDVPA